MKHFPSTSPPLVQLLRDCTDKLEVVAESLQVDGSMPNHVERLNHVIGSLQGAADILDDVPNHE